MISQFAPIVLAFGANLGDRERIIRAGQAQLAAHPKITDLRCSQLVASVKLTLSGVDTSGPQYLNGVATGVTSLQPVELLSLVQRIETEHGRVRHEKWGDRTLDIDIIQYGGTVLKSPELTLPHPEAHKRDFVLAPWLQVDAEAVLLGHGRVRDLLQRVVNTTVPYTGDADV